MNGGETFINLIKILGLNVIYQAPCPFHPLKMAMSLLPSFAVYLPPHLSRICSSDKSRNAGVVVVVTVVDVFNHS